MKENADVRGKEKREGSKAGERLTYKNRRWGAFSVCQHLRGLAV